MNNGERLAPITPGEILKDFLDEYNISQSKLAGDLDIPISRINEITRGQRSITVDTAIRLAKYFSNSEGFWMNLQIAYELEIKKRSGEYDQIMSRIRQAV